MLFREYESERKDTIVLLHGGGLSDWSLSDIVNGLKDQYHVVTPIIDGHGSDTGTVFLSIEDSAEKLISWIDAHCDGHVTAICGLSIGAQIALEVLSQRRDIAGYAVIESALLEPIAGIKAMTKPMYDMSYGLIKKRWFAKKQAEALCLPEKYFEQYYIDSSSMSKETLINISLSNGTYKLKDSITGNNAKMLIIYGSKEIKAIQNSARHLNEAVPTSQLYIAEGMKHGQLSLCYPKQYLNLLFGLLENVKCN